MGKSGASNLIGTSRDFSYSGPPDQSLEWFTPGNLSEKQENSSKNTRGMEQLPGNFFTARA
jgi:hypothetical protein